MPFSGFSCPSGRNYHTSCLLLLPASGAFPLGASLIHSAENELACSANRDTMDFEANLAHCVSERCARGSSSLPGLQEEEEWGQKDTDTVQDGRGQLTPHCYRWICHIP